MDLNPNIANFPPHRMTFFCLAEKKSEFIHNRFFLCEFGKFFSAPKKCPMVGTSKPTEGEVPPAGFAGVVCANERNKKKTKWRAFSLSRIAKRRSTQGRVEGAFSELNWRLCTGSCSAGSTRPYAGLRPPSIAAFGRSLPSAAVDRGSRPCRPPLQIAGSRSMLQLLIRE